MAMPGNIELALRILGSRGITKINCHTCKKQKGLDEYSHRQLINYKDSIYNEFAPKGRCKNKTASCKGCIIGAVTHLECHVCGLTKPLSKFMKTQRRIPDQARCKRCVELQLDTERIGEVEDFDDYECDDTEEEDSDEDVDFPLGTKMHASRSATCPGSDYKDVDSDMAKAVGQMSVDAARTPDTSYGGNTTLASTFASIAGSVTTAATMSDEWSFVSSAGKAKSYRNNKSTMGGSSITVGTEGECTSTAGSVTQRRVGGWIKEKIRLPLENEWGVCTGGQPRLFKKKQGGKKNHDYEDDLDEDDGEEI
ncbi:Stc1 domain-containing protein [Tirmania nivea]|nr:Stc1 domain-containing protein [Tirmania nivea]